MAKKSHTKTAYELYKEKTKKQRQDALKKLDDLTKNKIIFKKPVFFVPGWTDESSVCWKSPYKKSYVPIKEWIPQIAKNSNLATYITFTEKESEKCKSFFDFADILKKKIRSKISKNEKFDIVAHSMGGLDTVAAITDEDEPLLNVNNFITVATPHQGSELGEIGPIFNKYKSHHAIQCINLDPDQLPIKLINKLETRKQLLKRINKLYSLMGTQDMAVMRSARYNKKDLDPDFYKKKVEIREFSSATHSQKYGITQDVRVILAVISILVGIELEKPKYNYGYIFKR